MLSGPELVRRLKLGHRRRSGLVIIPTPDLRDLEDKGAASIDLRLGRWFLSLRQAQTDHIDLSGLKAKKPAISEQRTPEREHFVPFGSSFILHPGRFVIGATLEWMRLPLDAGAYVTGKSSLGRYGLVIETAAAIHPRFTGCLALEMANLGEVPLILVPGMPVAQLLIHKTTGRSKAAKTGFGGRRKPFIRELSADDLMEMLSQHPVFHDR